MGAPFIQIAVAAHKSYRMPADPMYLPVQVGAALHPEVDLGFQKDSEGSNISDKNGSYCELTALYWMWKNSTAQHKGLAHYRRHFGTLDAKRAHAKDRFERIATEADIRKALESADVVLPKKRNYYIETVYDHYSHTFDGKQFDAAREVLQEKCPEYVPAWDELMAGRTAYLYNMFAMSAENVDTYCSWLFPLLDELEKRIDSSKMDAFQARWVGRVAERLLNAWVATNNLRVIELPAVSPEPINWSKKISGFLAAKFLGKKYGESF